jgi:pimeloyl-ACP methyl ester carboxylesterase
MHPDEHPDDSRSLAIGVAGVQLTGDLTVPSSPRGMIVFAHGSGSSRTSPRNRSVAQAFVDDGFATLLFDLLTRDEEIAERHTRHLRFDIDLLADRLVGAIAWVGRHDRLSALPLGLFGASTGAAAALIASTRSPAVGAVVSRGGRPDLAADALPRVRCPTLLIVGGADRTVLDLNRRAATYMTANTETHVVPHAGHLFEEPGALRDVIDAAAAWFRKHLATDRDRQSSDQAERRPPHHRR